MEIGLRQLARRYYDGELAKSDYRRARRNLLMAALDGKETEEENTLPIQKGPQAGVDKKQPPSTAQAIPAEKKKQPQTFAYLVVIIFVLAAGVAYRAFMQPGQNENASPVQTTVPTPLSELDVGMSATTQAPVSEPMPEEQALAENLIYIDEWGQADISRLVEKLSMADFSAQPWYQQLMDEVQTRQELLALDAGQTTNTQYLMALDKLALALGMETHADNTVEDINSTGQGEEQKIAEDNLSQAKEKPDSLSWEVGLIVSRDEKKLHKQQQLLEQHSVQAMIVELDDKPGHWRLYLKGYASKEAAETAAKKIQRLDLGYDKPWVKQRKDMAGKR